jgi:hypothetical protein
VRVEILEEDGGNPLIPRFPPAEDGIELRANPEAVEEIAAARQYLPVRNFLDSVNGPESAFVTSNVSVKSDLSAVISAGSAYEFASQATIVFAAPLFNWELKYFVDLCSSLKELLERDTSGTVRALMRISPCDFTEESRRGFCLSIRLVADGNSAQQAELRWGLGLARVQQALLFRSRALKQQVAG